MNLFAPRTLCVDRPSQLEEHAPAGRINALLGLSAVLLAGLVTTARAQTPGSAISHLKLGIERYRARDFDTAIAEFSQAIEINSGFVKPLAKKRTNSNFKDNEEAGMADDDRIIVADLFNALAYYDRGITWHAMGDVDRAIDDLNKAIGINPRYTDAYVTRGSAWHSKGDFGRAIADYDQAIALDPRSAFAYNNRGIARKDMQDMAAALSDFDRAIMLNSGLVQAYINRGAARCAAGDLSGATADLNKAIAGDPRNPMAYNDRGAARQAAGDFTGALDDYNMAILLDPANALAYVNRGLTRLQQGNITAAETDFKQGLALAPALKPRLERSLRGEKRLVGGR